MITVLIATRGRTAKLRGTIESIEACRAEAGTPDVEYLVVFDGDARSAEESRSFLPPHARTLLVANHSGSVACRNAGLRITTGDVLYATDDVVFAADSIRRASAALSERFPDRDAVVGFTQIGSASFNPAGVALVGDPFLARFPERALFFPGYFHFACQEVHRAAVLLGRFYLAPDANLIHLHPSFDPRLVDRTHREARIARSRDRALSCSRKADGKTWGIEEKSR